MNSRHRSIYTIAFEHTNIAQAICHASSQAISYRCSNSHPPCELTTSETSAAGIPEISAAAASRDLSCMYAVRNANLCFINKPTDKVEREVERENAPSSAASNSRVFTFESASGLIRCTRDPSRTANPTETFTLNRAVSCATTSTSVQQIGFKAYAIIKQASCCIRLACSLVASPPLP